MDVVKVYIAKFVILVFALQMLNLSVCGGEGNDLQLGTNAHTIGELNQIDCLVEFVSEIILHFENSIKETGFHNSNENHSLVLKTHLTIKLFPHNFCIELPKISIITLYTIPLKEDCKSLFCKEVIPQPPNQVSLFARVGNLL